MEQLKEITAIIYEMFNFYYGNKIYLVIALAAAVYAAIRGTRRTRIIVGASLIIMLVIWNPLIYKVLFSGIVFWRLFWLVPTFLLITLGFAVALSRLNKKVFRLIFTIAAMAVIMFLGTNIYKELWSDTYRDYYKLPRGTASVGQIMLDIDDHPRCVLPQAFISYMREFNGDIEPMYGRNADGYINTAEPYVLNVYNNMISDAPDYDYVLFTSRLNGYNFVINNDFRPISEVLLNKYGYELIYISEGYCIYYNPNVSDDMFEDPSYEGSRLRHDGTGWWLQLAEGGYVTSDVVNIYGYDYYFNPEGYLVDSVSSEAASSLSDGDILITQYGRDYYGGPTMFYTIDDLKGHFIVIDGGNPDEAEYVMNRIRMYGNHVDAWILTHPHSDHIGAFNEIYRRYVTGEGIPNENGVRVDSGERLTIDNIFAIDLDEDYYAEIARSWDGIETYYDFNSLAEDMDNLTYVERGSTYETAGITFKVYNTFTDESYDIYTGSLPNAASMVLEVFGPSGENGESMLFLGDLEQGNADLISSLFGDELSADYVQAAHHGQNVDYDFYELIGAHTAFVDAPGWLRLENPDTHTSYEHLVWFNENGYDVLTYDTTPNTIVLHAAE